ncbi:MAG: matrixin family metalloprotease [Acidimicrobiia bacterium]|nr:matrixin family metalloprotease [Acidimicrobiia bacterium]
MSLRQTLARIAAAAAFVMFVSLEQPGGYATFPDQWPNGTTVTMHMQLGGGSGTLIDGSTSWNQAATTALSTWNNHIDLVKFGAVQDSTSPIGDRNGVNNVVFDSTIFGEAFPSDTVALANWWISRGTLVEANITFNTAFSWNSYRGPLRRSGGRTVYDIVRVTLHEAGHVLGLDHPDENRQSVSALMNSTISDLDALTADDIAGGRALYGGGVASNITFPPRNEPNDFFNQLIALYRDRLGEGQVTTYVDPEGAVVWLSEYARYRVGLCDHATAQTRVFSQIDNTGTYGVCALTPAGTIPFPPRDEGLQFMLALDAKYRDDLRRTATTSFVNNEGAVVWVLEYFRYRLNRCNHADATTRVFQQILGQGIQPTC